MADVFRQFFAAELTKAADGGDGPKVYKAVITAKSADRMGDVVDPARLDLRAYRRNPVVLFSHDARAPIGRAGRIERTDDKISAEFTLAGTDKGREVAQLIDDGVLSGVSIGFRATEKPTWNDERRGLDFGATELLEFSVVSIPAHADALIYQRAAPVAEPPRPPLNGRPRPAQEHPPMSGSVSVGEQIAEYSRTRQERQAQLERMHGDAADENRALDENEQVRFDSVADEIRRLDAQIKNAKQLEQLQLRDARPVGAPALGPRIGPQLKRPEKGVAFARFAMALTHARRFGSNPIETAKVWRDSTPEVELAVRAQMQPDFQRAAVLPALSSNSAWAGALLPEPQYLGGELIEMLFPATILGRMSPRVVPFRVKVPRVTAAATANWVGEGKAKPVSAAAFDLVSLDFHKLAVLAVMSEELLRFGDPSVETTVRDILAESIRQRIDATFISTAASTANSPAGIVNGATSTTSTGGSLAQIEADLLAIMGGFANQNIPLSSVVVVMNPRSKLYLSQLRTANDNLAFPEISASGTWRGMRVIESTLVTIGATPFLTSILFISEQDVLLARDPGIRVDSSREATIEMSSDPEADTGAMVNLFQSNMVAILLEQAITWTKARANAVQILASVPY